MDGDDDERFTIWCGICAGGGFLGGALAMHVLGLATLLVVAAVAVTAPVLAFGCAAVMALLMDRLG